MIRYIMLLLTIGCLNLLACQREAIPNNSPAFSFSNIPSSTTLPILIAEASGIADSKKNGVLWVEEDSGNPPQLTALKYDGSILKKIFIKGAINRDWEDLCLADNTIYIGDIGDNNAAYPDYYFYYFPEPDVLVDTVMSFQKLSFKYSDGSHDAEAFIVEPVTRNIYIFSKRDSLSRIYKISAPFASGINTARLVGQFNYNGVVSAAMSTDGRELIIKTYFGLNYYSIASGQKIEDALQKSPTAIPYKTEPQGEAVCFANDKSGYFTLSEVGFGTSQSLFFYKRN